jgi:hypothetical protein
MTLTRDVVLDGDVEVHEGRARPPTPSSTSTLLVDVKDQVNVQGGRGSWISLSDQR